MIYNLIKKYCNYIGIDGAIGYTILARIIQASGGLITIVFIALFLSQDQQGYYYTFGSLIAIQVFFELGLNSIITQYVAHETAHLTWNSNVELSGNEQHLSRLSSLLRFCLRIYGFLALMLFIALEISGYIFFTKYQHGTENVFWQSPWLLVAFSTSLMFVISPILAFIEGLGKVKEIAKLRFIQTLINIATIVLIFALNGGLFALGIASLVSFAILTGGVLFSYKKNLLLFIYRTKNKWNVDYWKEIFPYQYRIALSWISGYFIFQLFNPVLFATEGPKIAGQMGMTLTAMNGISSLSMSWISTKSPTFSRLIALKNYQELDRLFNKTLRQLSIVNFTLILIFISLIYVLNLLNLPIANRFLNATPLVFLCLVTFANQFTFSWATYLRCHKKEPFLINSIVIGLLCASSTLILGKYFGLWGIVSGYSVISILIGLPWGYYIFKTKKLEWHKIRNHQ